MRILVMFLSCACSFKALCQTSWTMKEVGNKISVKFPSNPTYKPSNKTGVYTSGNKNVLTQVIVKYDALPNYTEFVKLQENQQHQLIDVFLDNAIKGVLKASRNEGTSFNSITLGDLKGRETSFGTVNPLNGEKTIKWCKLFYSNNKVYMFQVMYLNNTSDAVDESHIFLNSIKAN